MKIIQKSTDVLIVRSEKILFVVFGSLFLICSCSALYSFFAYDGTIQGDIFFGQTAAAIVLLLFALFCFENSEFAFDRRRQSVIWRIRTVFTHRSGALAFTSIKSIIIQGVTDTDNNRHVRVAIKSESGELPLSKAYTGNTSHMIGIAEKLNKWVFNNAPDLVIESVKASLADGRRVDAAITLRRAYGLSMNEAKTILDNPEKLDALPPAVQAGDFEINTGDKELVLGITALITLVCGPLMLILGIHGYFKSIDTIHWRQAEALVKASGMHREIEDDEYRFALEYSYTVNSVNYQSNVLYIQAVMSEKKAYPIIPKIYLKDYEVVNPGDYRPGNNIMIYYDPDDPQSSVVIRGVSGGIWAMMIAGVLFTLIYLYLARRDLRRRPKQILR